MKKMLQELILTYSNLLSKKKLLIKKKKIQNHDKNHNIWHHMENKT